MGHVFRRSSGRGWRLRQRSMALWPEWIAQLQRFEPSLSLDTSLVQIAEDDAAFERMQSLASDRGHLGLRTIPPADIGTIWPTAQFGALESKNDGRINPLLLQRALRLALAARAVELVPEPVEVLTRKSQGWQLNCSGGQKSFHDVVVVCAALASPASDRTPGPQSTDQSGLGTSPCPPSHRRTLELAGMARCTGGSGIQFDPRRPKPVAPGSNRGTRGHGRAQPLRTDAIHERQSTRLVEKRRAHRAMERFTGASCGPTSSTARGTRTWTDLGLRPLPKRRFVSSRNGRMDRQWLG